MSSPSPRLHRRQDSGQVRQTVKALPKAIADSLAKPHPESRLTHQAVASLNSNEDGYITLGLDSTLAQLNLTDDRADSLSEVTQFESDSHSDNDNASLSNFPLPGTTIPQPTEEDVPDTTFVDELQKFTHEYRDLSSFPERSTYGNLIIPLRAESWLRLGARDGMEQVEREALYHLITAKTLELGVLIKNRAPPPPAASSSASTSHPPRTTSLLSRERDRSPDTDLEIASILLWMKGRPLFVREETYGLYHPMIRDRVVELGHLAGSKAVERCENASAERDTSAVDCDVAAITQLEELRYRGLPAPFGSDLAEPRNG